MKDNELCDETGRVRDVRPVVGFLYNLMRDHLPVGTVAKLVADSEAVGPDHLCTFSNGHLARYAQMLAGQLEPTVTSSQDVVLERIRDELGARFGVWYRSTAYFLDRNPPHVTQTDEQRAQQEASNRSALDSALALYVEAIRPEDSRCMYGSCAISVDLESYPMMWKFVDLVDQALDGMGPCCRPTVRVALTNSQLYVIAGSSED